MKLGKYKHYKGNYYEVIGDSIHTETREILVVYRALYSIADSEIGTNPLFVRPKKMFCEMVKVDDKVVPRFMFIKNQEDEN